MYRHFHFISGLPRARSTLLPPDMFKRFSGMEFRRDLKASQAHVITAQPASASTHRE